MSLDLDAVFEDTQTLPQDDALGRIAALAQRQLILEDEVADLESMLKNRKEDLRKITDAELPAAMQEVGMTSFTLTDGAKIDVKPYYDCSINDERRDAAHAWLRGNDHGDLIKHELKASFGKGEDDTATAAKAALEELGVAVTDKEAVHPQTLKAFVREQIEAGAEGFPLDLFGAHVGQRAKITPRKGN
jgi:hypothetical protein